MYSKVRVTSFVLALAFSTVGYAADKAPTPGAVFDYQGQGNLGLAPETPDEAATCRDLDQSVDDVVVTDQQDAMVEAPATIEQAPAVVPPKNSKTTRTAKQKKNAVAEKRARAGKGHILSASSDLDERRRRCGVLTAAAVGGAGYVARQAAVDSGPSAAGFLLGAAAIGGGVALAMSAPSDNNPAAVPFPIPGVGLLSYLAIGGSGAAVWLRRRFQKGRSQTGTDEPEASAA